MQQLKHILPYLSHHKLRISIGVLAIAGGTAFATLQPAVVGRAIDGLRHGLSITELTVYVLILLAAAVGQAFSAFLQRSTVNRVSRFLEYDLRNDAFRHLQTLDQDFYQEMHTGDLMARLTNDLNSVRQFVGMGLINLISTGFMLVVVAVLMVLLDWRLAIVAFAVLPFVTVTMVVVSRSLQHKFRLVQDQWGVLSTQAQENFSGIRVVKAFVQEDREISAFAHANEEFVRRNLTYVRLSGVLWPLMFFVVGIAMALVLFFGGNEVAAGNLTIGKFVQFNAYLAMLTWPMISLGYTINMYQQGAASMARIMEVMHRQPKIRDTGRTLPIRSIQGRIEFRNVGVKYGEAWVFRNVSFAVEPDTTTAIIGMTGVGKTTLMSLIPRILEADEGEVLIDDVDVRRIPIETLRRAVGFVSQDNFLFSATIRENVSFGVHGPSEEALRDAVEASRLVKDLEQFPNGWETVVGERGVSLSGGQKQRTSLARALMRDPTILILDDAMSSVDTHTQAEILQRLRAIMAERTTLISAMRISTIKDADQIVVLGNESVAEIGNHQKLLRENGLYARMYRRELLRQELEVEEDEQVEAGRA
jgi:ATP-binding cassette subfamily B protein